MSPEVLRVAHGCCRYAQRAMDGGSESVGSGPRTSHPPLTSATPPAAEGSAANPPVDELTFTAENGLVVVNWSGQVGYRTPGEMRRHALEAYAQADLAELQASERRGPLFENGLA